MMDLATLLTARQNASDLAEGLVPQDIPWLVGLLAEMDNDIRYSALLVLMQRSSTHDDIYPYWEEIAQKLAHENSYQRSIGVMLLSENVRWDKQNKLQAVWPRYAACFHDEKFVTARQTIQSLATWLAQKPEMQERVCEALTEIQPASLPETQRKLILLDILQAFVLIVESTQNSSASAYLFQALDSGLLNKKERDSLRKRLGFTDR